MRLCPTGSWPAPLLPRDSSASCPARPSRPSWLAACRTATQAASSSPGTTPAANKAGTETPISLTGHTTPERYKFTVEMLKNAWQNKVPLTFSTDADYYVPGKTRGEVAIEFIETWKAAGHTREPRVSVSRSIFALMNDMDRAYFGRDGEGSDSIGYLGDNTRAIFGRSYAAEPDVLIEQLKEDEAIAEADTLLLTVPNQLGVDYNAHVIESILKHVAPALGWR